MLFYKNGARRQALHLTPGKREKDMPARWLQQKKLKQKRMRRAWAKKFAFKNTGPMRTPGYISQGKNKELVGISIKDISKRAGFWLDDYLLDKFKFNPHSNESIYARYGGLHTDLTPDKEIVLARLNQSRNNAGSLQGEEKFVYAVRVDNPTRHLRLYMGREVCFFLEQRIEQGGRIAIRRSIEYHNKFYAIEAEKKNDIAWIELTYKEIPS